MKVMTAKEEWDGLCRLVGEATDRRGKRLFLPLRAALCGRTDGPTMAAIFGLLSEKKVRARFWPPLNMRPVRLDLSAIFFVLL